MNARLAVVATAAALLMAFAGLHLPSADGPGDARPATEHAGPHANAPAASSRASASSVTASSVTAFDAAPVAAAPRATAAPLPPAAPDAAQSLADAIRDGDARTPPIARDERVDEPPTVNELADPSAYRRYEARRQARVHRAFEREASIALTDQRRDLERARAQGAPPEILAEGEEKAQKLADTLQRLRDGALDRPSAPAPTK